MTKKPPALPTQFLDATKHLAGESNPAPGLLSWVVAPDLPERQRHADHRAEQERQAKAQAWWESEQARCVEQRERPRQHRLREERVALEQRSKLSILGEGLKAGSGAVALATGLASLVDWKALPPRSRAAYGIAAFTAVLGCAWAQGEQATRKDLARVDKELADSLFQVSLARAEAGRASMGAGGLWPRP